MEAAERIGLNLSKSPHLKVWRLTRRDGGVVGVFPTKREANEAAEIGAAIVTAFQAATRKRLSALEEAVARALYELDYAERKLRSELSSILDDAQRDLARLDRGESIFHDGTSFARSGAEIGIAASQVKEQYRAIHALLRAVEKAEPDGDVAIALSVYRFFRGEGVRS